MKINRIVLKKIAAVLFALPALVLLAANLGGYVAMPIFYTMGLSIPMLVLAFRMFTRQKYSDKMCMFLSLVLMPLIIFIGGAMSMEGVAAVVFLIYCSTFVISLMHGGDEED